MNKTNAKEWLFKSYHDLDAAVFLIKEKHFTDTISCILQQALEKLLKSILASENKQIKKTHNLLELYEMVCHKVVLEDKDIRLLTIATVYSTQQRYPAFKQMPSRDEVKAILTLTVSLFENICKILDIEKDEIIMSEVKSND